MRPDDAMEKATALVAEAKRLLEDAEREEAPGRVRIILADAVQVVGEARGNLTMLAEDIKSVTP